MSSLLSISRQAIDKRIRVMNRENEEREMIVSLIMHQRQLHPRMGTNKLYHLVKHQFLGHDIKCGRDKLYQVLREEGLLVKRRKNYTRTTNSYHRFYKYSNLLSELEINKPEQVYVNDITYIRLADKHMYLSLTTDAYSKRIMGYHLSEDMRVSSVMESVKMAIQNSKKPKESSIILIGDCSIVIRIIYRCLKSIKCK